jgi:hypothetical protein
MEGGPPQPYPVRCSGWLSPEDHGDPGQQYALVDYKFLELIVERLVH